MNLKQRIKFLWVLGGILMLSATQLYAQSTVSGIVINGQTEAPLIGANILIKGTTTGTATDKNGKFKVSVPSLSDTLVVTYIGFVKKQVPINSRTKIKIKLKPKEIVSEQLVVTAYGVQRERQDIVGAVTTLSEHQLKMLKTVPTGNLTAALAGRIPGIIAFQRTGAPGANNAEFFVRGVTSFGFDNSPLILIDNVKSTPTQLANLNPSDIASFTILKDATATSLYGSEAANGVLLIKTKVGHQTPLRVSFRVSNIVSMPTDVPEFADPVTYMKAANNATLSRDPLQPLPYSREKIAKTKAGVNPILYPSVDWRNSLFKDYTMNQKFNLHVSGGGEIAQYYVSGSLKRLTGLLKVPKISDFNNNINVKNYSLRSNININLTNSTELALKLGGLFDDYQGPLQSAKGVFHNIVNASPVRFLPKYPVDSTHAYTEQPLFGGFKSGGTSNNPYANMVKGYKHYARTTLNAQFRINQDFSSLLKGLNMEAIINIQRFSFSSDTRRYKPFFYKAIPTTGRSESPYTLQLLNPGQGTNFLSYQPGKETVTSRLYFQGNANYRHTFGKKNNFNALLVFTARNQTYDNVSGLEASLPHRNVNIASRLAYNYDQTYYVSFNLGLNASERFAKNHRWGFFPSIGVAWNVSSQDFWTPLHSIVTNFKLKATYGLSGNDKIGSKKHRFLYLSVVDLDDGSYSFLTGIGADYRLNGVSIQAYKNAGITWERSKKLNLGVHMSFLNSLELKGNFYYQDRTNILQERVDLPASLGLSSIPKANTGEVKTHGFEGRLVYHLYDFKNWMIAVRGNFTYSKSKIVKFSEPNYPDAPLRTHIGIPVSTRFGLVADRLFIDEADVKNLPNQNFGPYGPGDIKYRDINGDGKITNLDKVPLGYPTIPEITYGFGFSLHYKNFDFSGFFEGIAHESFWINVNGSSSIKNQGTAPFVGGHQLLKAYAKNHWTTSNRKLAPLYPHFSTSKASEGVKNNSKRSTWFMRNGAFLRVKSIQFGYSFPDNIIENIGLRKLRIYLTGRNLYHFSPFDLWDPEMAGNGLGYPLQTTFAIGLNVKF